jgi:hypothetical protein
MRKILAVAWFVCLGLLMFFSLYKAGGVLTVLVVVGTLLAVVITVWAIGVVMDADLDAD